MATKDKYQKYTPLEHILARPDTYVGSLETDNEKQWVLNKNKTGFDYKTIKHIPGLYKIYDEILVNAIDQASIDNKLDTIKVSIDANGTITVMNTGIGIPIEKHSKEDVYIPEMIFGQLLTSSNYDDNIKRTVGGRNGYGAKLANVFSSMFTLEVDDVQTQQTFTMTWTNNMQEKTEPIISKKACKKGLVKIIFKPDYKRFGLKKLDADSFALFEKRVYDACACTPDRVNVYFNDIKLCYKNFEKYVDLYIGNKKETNRIYESTKRWDVAVCYSDDGYKQISFVNGINTSIGGTHVDHVVRKIVNKIIDKIISKNANSQVKASFVKDHMFVFVKATLENPSFSSQTKTECTLKPQSFGSTFECSDDFSKKLLKLGIMEDAMALAKHKELRELSKTDGKKRGSIKGIPKLDDANFAGTSKSEKCTLFLTEGDSAKTFAVSGLSEIGRDYYGIFPLRGKLLNVREATPKQLIDNVEINAIKQILGLQQGRIYESLSDLRYGHIEILTDADVDGSHIKGLIINFIHTFWPSLLKFPTFIQSMVTPVIKVFKKNEEYSFYTISDYNVWKETKPCKGKTYTIKYYKGLGTSTSKEAKEYFRNKSQNTVYYIENDDASPHIVLAFKKDHADNRKQWILDGIQNNETIEYTGNNQQIDYSDFINKDLIQFSIADVERSIPSMIDGLKPSQRKVIFACRKRKNTEIKVSQLAGYASTVSAYHHGEQSMNSTIVGLAQNFVGSNNINLLQPKGQFGTRLMGGKDAASPRYIFTMLSNNCSQLIKTNDDPVLSYLNDDGMEIEPKYYVPTLPLVLINGADGIGTGYSSNVPCFNPDDIKTNIKLSLKNESLNEMIPWYNGFTGEIKPVPDFPGHYITIGKYSIVRDKLEITELPIGKWIQDYKEFLDSLIDDKIINYRNHSTEDKPHFVVKIDPKVISKCDVLKVFKLTSNLSTKNMHLFDANGNIKKYATPNDIIEEFVLVRMKYYQLRKNHIISQLTSTLDIISNKVRFIEMVTNDEIIIFKKKKDSIVNDLKQNKFTKIDDSYDYLLNLKLYNLTHENIVDLKKQHKNTQSELSNIKKLSTLDMWTNDLS
uniref:DNA topoisomerase (ATP-hydrolyzing) n=1 Tax=viral metagenome TaxID=1070528 RepID=A0A6C0F911_9ZZZZ|tara:strand:- start:19471 stop:22719 length:3249 start_codon:yes stop_codon:yes gene_type:complete